MYITLHLLLVHFLADYPLQSNKLMKYKQNHLLGILLHSSVHLILSIIIALPFISYGKVLWSILIIFIAHNIVDQVKVLISKYTKLNQFAVYVLDQLVHVAIIYLIAIYFIGEVTPSISGFWLSAYTNNSIISFLLTLAIVTYFYDISKWAYLSSKKPKPYKRDYKMMIRNAFIVTVGFGAYWILY